MILNRMVVCVSLLLVAACKPVPPVSPVPVGMGRIGGELPNRPMQGGEFYNFVQTDINWIDQGNAQRCVNPGPSCQSQGTVAVHVFANQDAWQVDPRRLPVEPSGIVVVKVLHMGGRPTANYHFRPAPFEYYFVVYQSASTHAPMWVLRETSPSGSDVVVDGPYNFPGCWDHQAATSAEAKFKDCVRKPAPSLGELVSRPTVFFAAASNSDGASGSNERATSALVGESAAWFSCVAGCCTLDYI